MFEKRFVTQTFRIGVSAAVILFCTQATGDPEPPSKRSCKMAYKSALDRERSGKLREAKDSFSKCSKATCGKVRAECKSSYARLTSDIPSIVPVVTDASGDLVENVQVTMDGELLTSQLDGRALPVDPGAHEFSFSTSGAGIFATQKILISQGERFRRLAISIQPPDATGGRTSMVASGDSLESAKAKPKPMPKSSSPESSGDDRSPEVASSEPPSTSGAGALPYVIGGVGVAAVGTGVLFTLWGRRDNDLLRDCAPFCAQTSVDRVSTLYTAATISLGVGVAAIGVATVLFATSGPSSEKATTQASYRLDVQPGPSGGLATLSGSF